MGGVRPPEQGTDRSHKYSLFASQYSLPLAFVQDLRESAVAVKRKQKISYDDLGESPKNKAKL